MELTVLGCATPYPQPGQPCSGYLITEDDTHVVLDCGSGTFAALQNHVSPAEVTALWISHLHPDHSADLLAWSNWALNTPGAPKISVYGPSGWADRLVHMLTGTDDATLVRETFTVHELHDGHTAIHGPLALTSRAVVHSVPTFGVRVESPTAHLAYSGDTEPCPALRSLADNTDVFLCEAGTVKPSRYHTTPDQAAETALGAHAKHLLLTHLAPDLDPHSVRVSDILTTIVTPGWRWTSDV
ncbi:MBL fold metallo-hydrolase [Actinokineospora inagensis]|uniref:MBL fold metallo-hydrolase n=1 Tax=Actinokineospora inagensis TaxID=103730 RepID=UPI0006876C32|nr:MBL fold metallo-hydrolase [Actinokineospora inagensis]